VSSIPESIGSIPDRVFSRVQAVVHGEAGIWLPPVKKALVTGRLARRLRELSLDWAGYVNRVDEDPAELVRMLDSITTNETSFFREPQHFRYLEAEVLPGWIAAADRGARPRLARVWSAACSTGEEPYSLAMTLVRVLPASWDIEVIATDLSTRALARAIDATWPIQKAPEVPEADRKRFMLRGFGSKEGLMTAGPEIRSVVRFARVNLNERAWPIRGPFDLVFCRNVLIYFDRPTKERVVGQLLAELAPSGLLFLGHAESLTGMGLPVTAARPTVYRLRDASRARGRDPR
jgi:chemotaxis protein methyltransferase CheR